MKPKAEELAKVGFQYLGIPYSEMDCQAFVEKCLSDVGIKENLPGSNAWYRRMSWVGTPEECKRKYGKIPVGAFLFILKQDGREPEKYKPDGIGNASHIGIYTATGLGAINSSSSRGCVCESKFAGKAINGGWNRIGLWDRIDYGFGGGEKMSYQARVVGGALNLRASASKTSDRLAQIPDGSVLHVEEEDGEWAKVTYNGKTGWVMTQYLEKTETDSDTIVIEKKDLEAVYNTIGDWLGLRG